jgi:8-oxo-dGTP diphosphatase
MPLARANGIGVLVSSRHPAHYWDKADGVHLTAADLHQRTTRPQVRWCIASCHEASDLTVAAALNCDAAMLGNVLATRSHPERAELGWSGFAEKISANALPVFALGGLNLNEPTLRLARGHGAHGVAAQRAAW